MAGAATGTAAATSSRVAAEQDKRTLPEHAVAVLTTLPRGTGLLVCTDGPTTDRCFPLTNERTTAGRHPDSDIVLDHSTVSLRHAEFVRHGRALAVRDRGSRNGTHINRERIEEQPLTPRDEIRIGTFRLIFLIR